jgi:hypothetical protein
MGYNWIGLPGLWASAGLTLTAVVGFVWQSRSRSARRRHAALDAYAQREITRAGSRAAAR